MPADVVAFPRERFIISEEQCRTPGPEHHLACFAQRGHDGPHEWADWRGCRMRTPNGVLPFGGFVY